MAAVNNAYVFGNHLKRPTATELATAANLETSQAAQVKARHLEFPTPLFPITLQVPSVSAGTDGYSPTWPIPFPVTVHGVDLGCNSAAGATGTMDVEVSADNGSTWASIFAAAKDVKTAAGVMARYAPEADTGTTTRNLDYGVTSGTRVLLRVKGTSGSGGALAGGHGVLWLQQR